MGEPTYRYFRVTTPREYVAHVEINRPEKANAFIEPMWHELKVVFDRLSDDPSVRAIVFSGAGDKSFSAGLDLQNASAEGSKFNPRPEDKLDAGRQAFKTRKWALEFQHCVSSIERCEKPVICVMHGMCIGLTVDIVTCTDLRICTTDSVFSVKEVDVAITSDVGTLARLPKVVGSYAWVKDVCLTGRNFDAEEALRVGFVTQVLPTKAEAVQKALETADSIAAKSPLAVQGTKNCLDWCRDHDVASGLRYMAVWNGGAINTQDVPLAMKSILTKGGNPRFEKL
ncbi:putative delta-delta-dienoyl-CoA isomerase mitochondrial precursor [Dactylonectria estremocensis]|uniref:Delta-delta-dienoyl-CoA isomerase mitochondrial n=1 Tax=Dactylonectria estremocensis TaxID=1079267 RepID=A0A9P9J3X1_9HYPO|nr:putative delta-delta-dienoyl-CoA isomerase mitochondrial precursor [Dactylonectria estremocensis]